MPLPGNGTVPRPVVPFGTDVPGPISRGGQAVRQGPVHGSAEVYRLRHLTVASILPALNAARLTVRDVLAYE